MFRMLKKEKISSAYVSKHNSNRQKKVILLIIPNREKSHYVAVKKNKGDFYCLNCLHSFRAKTNLNFIKKVCENKDFSNITMASKDTKILAFNQYQKSDKTPLLFMQILNL